MSLFEFGSLALNFCLCLDIILTLRNPFYPHERRMKHYITGSIILSIFCFTFSLGRFEDKSAVFLSTQTRALFSTGILSIYILFSVFSVAYTWRINSRKGMSSEVRQSFAWRHFWYVSCYLITWLPYYGFSFYCLLLATIVSPNVTPG